MKTCAECWEDKYPDEFYSAPFGQWAGQPTCKICVRRLRSEWAKANPEKHKARYTPVNVRWRARNRAQCAQITRTWQRANHSLVVAMMAARRAQKLQATPAWANKFFIEEAYDLAARRSKLRTGGHTKWHVDHIVPLRSKLVCGLHAEHNLQVIPSGANIAKGNRHWPGMP